MHARPTSLEWVLTGKRPSVWGDAEEEVVDRAELLRRKKETNRRPSEEVRRFRMTRAAAAGGLMDRRGDG